MFAFCTEITDVRNLRSLIPNLTFILLHHVKLFLYVISIFDQNFDLLDKISDQAFCIYPKCPIHLFQVKYLQAKVRPIITKK